MTLLSEVLPFFISKALGVIQSWFMTISFIPCQTQKPVTQTIMVLTRWSRLKGAGWVTKYFAPEAFAHDFTVDSRGNDMKSVFILTMHIMHDWFALKTGCFGIIHLVIKLLLSIQRRIDLNQSNADSFVERMVKNNSKWITDNDDCHKIHYIFLSNRVCSHHNLS